MKTEDTHVKDKVPLQQVLQPGDWWSPNAQSATRGFAELQLLTFLHKTGKWHLDNQSWRCHLLPAGQWVTANSGAGKRLLFVVANFGCGALVWPDVRLEGARKHFMWDPSVKSLEWIHCFECTDFSVVLSKPVSPLHRRVTKGEDAGLCVCFAPQSGQGNFKGLLEWHASQGFAGVPEAIVQKVHKDLGLPELSKQEPKNECELVLEVVRHVNPDLTEEEAHQLLCKRAEVDCPDMALSEMDCEMLRDVVVPKDHDDIIDLAFMQAEVKRKRREYHQQVPKAVARHFEKQPAAKAKKGQATGSAALTKVQVQRHFEAGQHFSVIERLMPVPAKVVEDQANGRYLVAYPNVGRRSFSWTRRGQRECMIMTLEHLWACHEDATGEGPSVNFAELFS